MFQTLKICTIRPNEHYVACCSGTYVCASFQVPINAKKMADIKKLKPYLIGYEDFYDGIFEWPTSEKAGSAE